MPSRPLALCGFEHGDAIHGEEIGNVNAFGRDDNFRKQPLAFFERRSAQIVAVKIQQVEQEKARGGRSGEMRHRVRIGHGDARLDQAETGTAFVIQHRDLAVQDGLRSLYVARQDAQLGILLIAAFARSATKFEAHCHFDRRR